MTWAGAMSGFMFNAPHEPHQAPPEAIAKISGDPKRATYFAMVETVDAGIGRVLNALRRTGKKENTLVFFASDNGGERNSPGNNGAFRDYKTSVHEGGIHVPAVLSWRIGYSSFSPCRDCSTGRTPRFFRAA